MAKLGLVGFSRGLDAIPDEAWELFPPFRPPKGQRAKDRKKQAQKAARERSQSQPSQNRDTDRDQYDSGQSRGSYSQQPPGYGQQDYNPQYYPPPAGDGGGTQQGYYPQGQQPYSYDQGYNRGSATFGDNISNNSRGFNDPYGQQQPQQPPLNIGYAPPQMSYYQPPQDGYHRPYNPADYQPYQNSSGYGNRGQDSSSRYAPDRYSSDRYGQDSYGRSSPNAGYQSRDSDRNYDDDDSRGRRNKKHHDDRDRSLSGIRGVVHKNFDESERGLAAGSLGAIAGGFIGHKLGKGPLATVAGVVFGGLGANALEARHHKSREAEQRHRARSEGGGRRSSRYSDEDDYDDDRRGQGSRSGSRRQNQPSGYLEDRSRGRDDDDDDEYDSEYRDKDRRAKKEEKKQARRDRERAAERGEMEDAYKWRGTAAEALQ